MRGFLQPLGVLACLAFVLSGSSAPVPPAVQLAAKPAVARTTAAPAVVRSIAVGTLGMDRPVFDRDFPDPTVLTVGARYYAFGTHTAWERAGRVFPILESADLVHWSYDADVFAAAPSWGRGDWWAPAVVAHDRRYFLYYSGLSRSGLHCLAVATAGNPLGPYTDYGPIACQDGTSAIGYIDASPLVAAGKAYLYFSVDGPSHHSISVLPLSADMLGVAGPRVELIGVTQGWERIGDATVEGPSVFAWGSRYVMLYSGGSWRGRYGMGFAIASSPLGPFVKSSTPLLQTSGSLSGPGGGSFFTDSGGRPWLAYHAWSGGGRVFYASPLSVSAAV